VGIRVLVVDDNPHVRWRGQVYPVNATFHRFLAAFLDLPGAPVASIAHAVPLRDLPDGAPPPITLPLDPRIRTVATAPFDGIAGFLRHAPMILRANRPVLRGAVRDADLVWIKVPGSNAALAAVVGARAGVNRFTWVAGSAREVAAGRFRGPTRVAGMLIGAAYDAIGRAAGLNGPRVVVGRGLVDRDGVAASVLDPEEIRVPDGRWPKEPGRLRLAWAGRVAQGKGLDTVIDALGELTAELDVLGDGPARHALTTRAERLGVADRVAWHGHVAARGEYLDCLALADAFVFPSPAEGFPKVILDAMAVGLPVIASLAGAVAELVEARLAEPIRVVGDPKALAVAIRALEVRPARAMELSVAGAAFAAIHTRDAEAAKLVRLWRSAFPALPWD
jgi:glycosyltransferase involved in cell wall biosynthesis